MRDNDGFFISLVMGFFMVLALLAAVLFFIPVMLKIIDFSFNFWSRL